MSKQPRALEAADVLEQQVEAEAGWSQARVLEAATLLRSQHALIGELVEVVESLMHWPVDPAATSNGCYSDDPEEIRARVVLSKAQEQK